MGDDETTDVEPVGELTELDEDGPEPPESWGQQGQGSDDDPDAEPDDANGGAQ